MQTRYNSRLCARIPAVGLALVLLATMMQPGHSQPAPPYSVAASQAMPGLGTTGLITLPQQNGAQQAMAQSINNVCPSITMVASTPNQQNLATICQAMTFNALQVQGQSNPLPLPKTSFGLSENQLNGALQQLNGGAELLAPTSQASVAQTTQTDRQTTAIEQRLAELRNQTTGAFAADSGLQGSVRVADLSAPGASTQALLAQNQAPRVAYSIGPFGAFANGFGQFGSRDLTTTENGYSFNNAGFVVGADYRFPLPVVAGLAFGFSQSNTNFDTNIGSPPGQSLSGNLFQGSLYATYSVTPAWYVNAIGWFGGGNNNSRRHIAFGTNGFDPTTGVTTIALDETATGNFGSRIAGVTLASGYDFPYGPVIMTPILRFLYQHTGVAAFGEEGAMGANLQYGSSNVNTVASFLGGDAQYPIATSLGYVYPLGRFRWAHQYSPGNTAVSVAYASDPTQLSSFILPGTATSRNYFDLGVEASLQFSPTSSAFISYDAILGISHTSFNSFSAGIRVLF